MRRLDVLDLRSRSRPRLSPAAPSRVSRTTASAFTSSRRSRLCGSDIRNALMPMPNRGPSCRGNWVRYPTHTAAHNLTECDESPRLGFQALCALARWLGSRDERSAGIDLEEAASRTPGPHRDAVGTNGPASDAQGRNRRGDAQ